MGGGGGSGLNEGVRRYVFALGVGDVWGWLRALASICCIVLGAFLAWVLEL